MRPAALVWWRRHFENRAAHVPKFLGVVPPNGGGGGLAALGAPCAAIAVPEQLIR